MEDWLKAAPKGKRQRPVGESVRFGNGSDDEDDDGEAPEPEEGTDLIVNDLLRGEVQAKKKKTDSKVNLISDFFASIISGYLLYYNFFYHLTI